MVCAFFLCFNDTASTEIDTYGHTLSLHDALPVSMGGIIGGTALAKACGLSNVITLDMGGTSADISLIAEGTPVLTNRSHVGPYPLLVPMLDQIGRAHV